jgi:hypothetical protein
MIRFSSSVRPRRSERGSALVLAVFVLFLLTAMGVALLFLSHNEIEMSEASLSSKKAFYLAEAGLEDGRMTLLDITRGDAAVMQDEMHNRAGVDDAFNFDPGAVQVSFDGDDNPTFGGYGDDTPLRALTSFADGSYIAFLTNDPLEIVEAIVEPVSHMPAFAPAAITLLGPKPSFEGGRSNPSVYSGDDCGVTGGPFAPAVGTIGAEAEADAELGVGDGDNDPDFETGPYSDGETVADLTDPSHPLMQAAGVDVIDDTWIDCVQLQELIEQLRGRADYYCSEIVDSTCGIPATNPDSITFIDKQPTWSAGSGDLGQGILVVTGDADFPGNASWEGLVLVVGRGRILRSGGGNGSINGGIVVADIAGPDGGYGRQWAADDCTGGPNGDGFGSAAYQVNGNGSSSVQFCSGILDTVNPLADLRIEDFLQR